MYRCKECGYSRKESEGSNCMGCGEWICQYCQAFAGRHSDHCDEEQDSGAMGAEQDMDDAYSGFCD